MPLDDLTGVGREPLAFDPAKLTRSTIALPLLADIKAEEETLEEWEKKYKETAAKYNAAIFLNARVPGGVEKAFEEVRELFAAARKQLPKEAKGCRIGKPIKLDVETVCPSKLTHKIAHLLLRMDAERAPLSIQRIWPSLHDVIIEVNLFFKPRPDGREDRIVDAREIARKLIVQSVEEAIAKSKANDRKSNMNPLVKADEKNGGQRVDLAKSEMSSQYVFARLSGTAIQELVAIDEKRALDQANEEAELQAKKREKTDESAERADVPKQEVKPPEEIVGNYRAIFHIWPDFAIRSCITRSIATVKADAAHRSFTAYGESIRWAVMDSGIDATHPHFALHKNIDEPSTYHADFSFAGANSPLTDEFGHGTHVAGIVAGEQKEGTPDSMSAVFRELNTEGSGVRTRTVQLPAVSGMAPRCKLVSLKVLDEFGQGNVSNLIAAISHIQRINGHGRELHIHGVNISLGYPFDPKWFACGRSPLCVEVNRLVKSGVVVVVAAGNTGYGTLQTAEGKSDACLDLTINDPGNAEEAITVGSTHRDMPERYGVSFFSSKGPTGDGRYKPDLIAPGEKIISCATGKLRDREANDQTCAYVETSGTSMAAPHVSGAIAAFLSIRREYIGETARIKEIFTSTATDLRRDRYFQGAGVVDLMRAIQSV